MNLEEPVKIAIFHDSFGAIGGGEIVVIEMVKILNADIITTDTDPVQKIDPDVRVISSGKTIKFPPLKQISAAFRFFTCDYSKQYDLFIFAGNWSHAAAHRNHPNIWYCYTPVRAFYDLYSTFLSRQNFVTRQLFRAWVHVHRFFDQRSIRQVDHIIAISGNVQSREASNIITATLRLSVLRLIRHSTNVLNMGISPGPRQSSKGLKKALQL